MLIVYAGFVLLSVSYKWVKYMKKAKILSGASEEILYSGI